MKEATHGNVGKGAEAGFTLVEALVAVVVLIFGLMAVTNLLLVAASSNSVANQSTAATASASRAMDMLKSVTFVTTIAPGGLADNPGGSAFAADDGGKECTDPTLVFTEWHCNDVVPGVGVIHTHWWVTAIPTDPRLLYLRVRSEGRGALAGARSRAEFTSFRSCTNSDPATGGCPVAP